MTNPYPRIVRSDRKLKNTSAKCRCGEVGKYKTHIQYNIFRGDDEVVWACPEHKLDLDYLRETVRLKHDTTH